MKTTINTNERIFQAENFEGETILCNLDGFTFDKELLVYGNPVKSLKHYWNFKFESFGKLDLKEMLLVH